MTDSSYASGSTATPPKLIGGNLDFDDGFGSMFEGFGKRQSRVVEPPSTLGEATTDSPVSLCFLDLCPLSLYNMFAKNFRKTFRQPVPGC